MKQDEFQVGDKVWCVLWGEGTVDRVHNEVVFVKFPDFPFNINYNQEGKFPSYGVVNRTLFFSKPKVEASAVRPFLPALVGKNVVLVPVYDGYCIAHGKITSETESSIVLEGQIWNKNDIEHLMEIGGNLL